MKIIVYSAKPFDRTYLESADVSKSHTFTFVEARLSEETAVLAKGHDGACLFVNDDASAASLRVLAEQGIRLLALRSAGFNHVDLPTATSVGIRVGRVPAYSPHAVAEYAVALILTLNRKTHRAFARVREGNFSLNGLVGFDLVGRTVGIVGTGKIGVCLAQIMAGFGCKLLGTDIHRNPDCEALGMLYVDNQELFEKSDIISLHCPLTPETHHLINDAAIARMKPGVMIINTGRGALIDTKAAIAGLKSRRIGSLGLDVYEEEEEVFFEDLSNVIIEDDVLMRLLTFPNVVVTSHQAFLTDQALLNIAQTTVENINAFQRSGEPAYPVG